MKFAIGSDHGGFALKEEIKKYLESKKISFEDFGPLTTNPVDYPDYAAKVATAVSEKKVDAGILVCGTGIGMCIAANKFKGVRAVVLYGENAAKMAKAHNNANVLCFGGRTMKISLVSHLIDLWMTTSYEGGRHEGRLAKIDAL